MRLTSIPALALIVLLVAVSGCVCCMGLDSPLSKLKKPVAALEFPENATLGVGEYTRAYSNVYPTEKTAQSGIYAFAEKLGYSPARYGSQVDVFWEMTGISQYRSFGYNGSGPGQSFGGLVAVTGAPSTAASGYSNIRQIATATLPIVNDKYFNIGTVKNITYDGTVEVGDGGDVGRAVVDGAPVYLLACRYSNTYVLTYSFESSDRAQQAAMFAIGQIDAAG